MSILEYNIDMSTNISKSALMLKKTFIGGVSRKSAINAIEAAVEAENAIAQKSLKAKDVIIEAQDQFISEQGTLIAVHARRLENAHIVIQNLINKIKNLTIEKVKLRAKEEELNIKEEQLQTLSKTTEKNLSLLRQFKKASKWQLLQDLEVIKVFRRTNRNGARMTKTVNAQGRILSIETELLNGLMRKTTYNLVNGTPEETITNTNPIKKYLYVQALPPKKEIEPIPQKEPHLVLEKKGFEQQNFNTSGLSIIGYTNENGYETYSALKPSIKRTRDAKQIFYDWLDKQSAINSGLIKRINSNNPNAIEYVNDKGIVEKYIEIEPNFKKITEIINYNPKNGIKRVCIQISYDKKYNISNCTYFRYRADGLSMPVTIGECLFSDGIPEKLQINISDKDKATVLKEFDRDFRTESFFRKEYDSSNRATEIRFVELMEQ